MTNLGKYEKEIRAIIRPNTEKEIKNLLVEDIAVNKETGEIMRCSLSNCERCRFNDEFGCDSESLRDWLDSPYNGE